MLVWYADSPRGKVVLVATAFVLLTLAIGGISLASGDGLDAYTAWPMWLLVVVGTVLTAAPMSTLTYAAGADWLMVESRKATGRKRVWVDLYALSTIEVSHGGTTFHLWLHNKERGLSRSFEELQRDRRLWDLVYNGILHSVANGARINGLAVGVLELAKTPALKLREQNTPGDDWAL